MDFLSKSITALLLMFVFAAAATAAPVNLPTFITDSLTAQPAEPSPVDSFYSEKKPYKHEPRGIRVSAGADLLLDFSNERTVKGAFLISDAAVKSRCYTLKLFFGLAEKAEIYGEFGAISRAEFIIEEPGMKTILRSGTDTVYGAGITLSLLSFKNGLRLFSDTRYRETENLTARRVIFSPPLFFGGDRESINILSSELSYKEWQSALGASKTFSAKNGFFFDKITVYGGGFYCRLKTRAQHLTHAASEWEYMAVDWLIYTDTGPLEEKWNFGGFAGIAFTGAGDSADGAAPSGILDIQFRFFCENAVTARLGYRF